MLNFKKPKLLICCVLALFSGLTSNADDELINSIELYDISGRIILTKNEINTSSKKLNLEGLTSGSYFVKIATTKGTITKKIIKH